MYDNNEYFDRFIVRYDNETDDYICECWGGSTKHPDTCNKMSKDVESGKFVLFEFVEKKHQVYQWLLYIASTKTFPFHAVELIQYANTHWINWR